MSDVEEEINTPLLPDSRPVSPKTPPPPPVKNKKTREIPPVKCSAPTKSPENYHKIIKPPIYLYNEEDNISCIRNDKGEIIEVFTQEDVPFEKLFYYGYRFKQQVRSTIRSTVETILGNYYICIKWGTGGGVLVGAMSQVIGPWIGMTYGLISGLLRGIISDEETIKQLAAETRERLKGSTPVHGFWS